VATTAGWCAAPEPTAEQLQQLQLLESQQRSLSGSPTKASWVIPVAFHVISDGKSGILSSQAIAVFIDNLKLWISQYAVQICPLSRGPHQDKSWFKSCVFNSTNQNSMRKRLAKDTRSYLNVYSCHLGKSGILGQSTFPFPGEPTGIFRVSRLDPVALGTPQYPYGMVLAHEVGHYLGLYHTFESAGILPVLRVPTPGDYVADTPTQAFPTNNQCPIGIDSCPAMPGLDDIPNLMNYSTDECLDHFHRWAIRPNDVGRSDIPSHPSS
jgi:hypothetical protein